MFVKWIFVHIFNPAQYASASVCYFHYDVSNGISLSLSIYLDVGYIGMSKRS